ncbi:hypothetical protein ACWIGM_05075 [Bosea sp. NPDC055332]
MALPSVVLKTLVLSALLGLGSVPAGAAPSQLRLKDYGAALDCVTDDTAALNAAIADATSLVQGTNRIGWSGCLRVTSTINLGRVTLEGDEVLSATIRKDFPGGVLIRLNGCGGSALRNFSVPSYPGATPNSYIIYSASTQTPSCSVDRVVIENLYLSSGVLANAPFRNIELNGSGRVTPSGIREPVIRNVTAFGATGGNIYFNGLQSADISGLHTYSFGPGTNTDADVYMVSTAFAAADNSMHSLDIEGTLHLSNQTTFYSQGMINAISWGSFGLTGNGNMRIVTNGYAPTEFGTRPVGVGIW